MSPDIDVLGTHPLDSQSEVEQCILPLVVLFSIAAQENRVGTGPRMRGRGAQVPPGWRTGARRRIGPPMGQMTTPYVARPGMYQRVIRRF